MSFVFILPILLQFSDLLLIYDKLGNSQTNFSSDVHIFVHVFILLSYFSHLFITFEICCFSDHRGLQKCLIFPALPFYLLKKALLLHADFKTIYLKYTLPMCIIIYVLLYNVLPSWRRKAALISMQANINFIDNTTWKILFFLHLYKIIPQWFLCTSSEKHR